MTRAEKVRVLNYLRAVEKMSCREASDWGCEKGDFAQEMERNFKTQAIELHALAESLQAEIDEIEGMEIRVLSGKGERDDINRKS